MSSEWAPPPAPSAPPAPRGAGLAALLLFGGMAVIFATAALEARWLAGEPWSDALILLDPPELDGVETVPARVRRVPAASYPPDPTFEAFGAAAGGDADVDWERLLSPSEPVVALALPVADLAPLLDSGTLPEPGRPEVIAGHNARLEEFTLDGVAFRVVGRMRASAPIGHFAYTLPDDPAWRGIFHDAPESQAAALLRVGRDGMADILQRLQDRPDHVPGSHNAIGIRFATRSAFAWSVWIGLALMAAGGVRAAWLWCARRADGARWFGPLYREVAARPLIFLGLHALLYGVFFSAMGHGMAEPHTQHRLGLVVEAMFTQGSLGYVGDAYASGNIARAAVATWWNNYVVQTIGLTFLPPVGLWAMGMLPTLLLPAALLFLPLPLGVVKTAASFALVGLAMAPTHAHTASGYWFHGVTMVLELEAYIIACFVVVAWPVGLLAGLARGAPRRAAADAARLFAAGVGFTGLLLAVAGLYEAATLILLH